MSKIVDSGDKKVMKTWKTKAQAYAIIVSSLKKAWELDNKWNLTALWKKRNAMTAKQRENNPIKKKKTLAPKKK